MKANSKRCVDMLDRLSPFLAEHSATLNLGVRGAALVTMIPTLASQLRGRGAEQIVGRGEFLAGVTDRIELATELGAQLREIAKTAAAMDPDTAPVGAAQLRMPASKSYQSLLDTAAAFVTVLTPPAVTQAFTERDFPVDFVSSLSALATEFAAATGRKYAGRQQQAGGTLGLDLTTARAKAVVKELDAIVRKKLRRSHPELLGVWKAAARMESAPRPSVTPAPTPATVPAPLAPTPAG